MNRPLSSSPDLIRGSLTPFTPGPYKRADQILIEAAARAEAEGDIVTAHKLRREADQARLAALRSVQ